MSPRQSKATTAANIRLTALIREAFDSSPMNRAELAESSGVPDGTLAGILAGKKPVYADQMVGIANALGADLDVWVREITAAVRREQH